MVTLINLFRLANVVLVAAAADFRQFCMNSKNDLCMDVKDGAFRNGGGVQAWQSYPGSKNQMHRIEGPLLQTGNDYCLDLIGGDTRNGAGVQWWKCNGQNPNQWWTQDGQLLRKTNTNLCLDLKDGQFRNGAVFQVYTCDRNNKNQQIVMGGNSGGGGGGGGGAVASNNNLLNAQTFSDFWMISWTDFLAKHPILYQYEEAIRSAALNYQLPPQLIGTIALQESSANPTVNAAGLMQFSDLNAWTKYSGNKPASERQNVWTASYACAAYIRDLMNTKGGLYNALQGYSGSWPGYVDSIRSWLSGGHPYGPNLRRGEITEGDENLDVAKPGAVNDGLEKHRNHKRRQNQVMKIDTNKKTKSWWRFTNEHEDGPHEHRL